jgi:hypothetical protein
MQSQSFCFLQWLPNPRQSIKKLQGKPAKRDFYLRQPLRLLPHKFPKLLSLPQLLSALMLSLVTLEALVRTPAPLLVVRGVQGVQGVQMYSQMAPSEA